MAGTECVWSVGFMSVAMVVDLSGCVRIRMEQLVLFQTCASRIPSETGS